MSFAIEVHTVFLGCKLAEGLALLLHRLQSEGMMTLGPLGGQRIELKAH